MPCHLPRGSVQNLSGGELQRVAIVLCLGKPADVYLIDEPSAYLDSEQVRAWPVCLCCGSNLPSLRVKSSQVGHRSRDS